ncbi:MAG TPA: GAF domain-containing protein [Pseudolysinimonas sp.]|nr:GAF domain-containing protein [Pseudolysinimonas sp.]
MSHFLRSPFAGALLLTRLARDTELAFPSDPPLSHGSGPDPDRVLLIGGLVVGGAGVASHDLALGGHLARKLAARTGRGADVETRSVSKYDVATAAALLRAESMERFDAVMIVIGVRELIQLRPLALWRRDVKGLLGTIAESVPASVPVLLVGVAPFARDSDVPRFAVRWLEETVDTYNAVTRELCETSGVAEYVHFEPGRYGVRSGRDASAVYETWAAALAPPLDEALSRTLPVHRSDDVPDEEERLRAIAGLGVLDAPPNPRLVQIVQMTRGMLGLNAGLTILDDENVHVIAVSGASSVPVLPREHTFSDLAISSPGILVVPDALADPLYADFAEVAGRDPVRFFAGYPLEAPGGERIGALCVVDRVPRDFSDDEASLLRDLALRAQAVLWESAAAS